MRDMGKHKGGVKMEYFLFSFFILINSYKEDIEIVVVPLVKNLPFLSQNQYHKNTSLTPFVTLENKTVIFIPDYC